MAANDREEFLRAFARDLGHKGKEIPGVDDAVAKFLGASPAFIAHVRQGHKNLGIKPVRKIKEKLGGSAKHFNPGAECLLGDTNRKKLERLEAAEAAPPGAPAPEETKVRKKRRRRRKKANSAERATATSPSAKSPPSSPLVEAAPHRRKTNAEDIGDELVCIRRLNIGGDSRLAVVLPPGAEIKQLQLATGKMEIHF